MRCPQCGADSEVIDSRPVADGICRRRRCLGTMASADLAAHRFTTFEIYADNPVPFTLQIDLRGKIKVKRGRFLVQLEEDFTPAQGFAAEEDT